MASGFGFKGGRSRCFTHWQEFQKCYVQADFPQECRMQAEDYYECLHHRKEISRAKMVKAEFMKNAQHQIDEARKQSDGKLPEDFTLGLGLIKHEKDDGGKGKDA